MNPSRFRTPITSREFNTGSLAISIERERLRSDEEPFQLWVPLFEEELQDLSEVQLQLIERLALGMGAGESRYVTDVEASGRILLDNCGK